MTKTDRMMAIVLLLRSRKRMAAAALSEMFEVTIRTIYRDMQSLCEAGVPILSLSGAQGGYELMPGYFIPPVMFNLDEAVALFLGGNFISQRRGTPFKAAITTALVKLESILSKETRQSVALSIQSIAFSVTDDDIDHDTEGTFPQTFEVLTQAIQQRRSVHLSYRHSSSGEFTERNVSPYGLIFESGLWYLVGYCHLRDDLRMFRVSKMAELTLTEWRYEVPDDFDLGNYLHRRWAKDMEARMRREAPAINIKVSHSAEGWLNNHWLYRHAARKKLDDGSTMYTVHSDAPEEVLHLVRQLGGEAEVTSPAEVRELVAREARKIMVQHEGNGAVTTH